MFTKHFIAGTHDKPSYPLWLKIKTNPGNGVVLLFPYSSIFKNLKHSFKVTKEIESEAIDGSEEVKQVAKYQEHNGVTLSVAKDIYEWCAHLENEKFKVHVQAEPKNLNTLE